MGRYRFPGLRAFEETEAAIFNGRAKEKQTLFDLIMVERSVVMFAKSGAGKSSLLRAGITPMLADMPYQPVYIRLNRIEEPLLQQVCRQISQVFGIAYQKGETLWEFLQKVDANTGNVTPIFIFDQFEELFTLYRYADRQVLIGQLADVINGTLPKTVHNQLIGQAAGLPDNNRWIALEKPPRTKFVFAIRSDLLSYLHELSDNIPSILRNRFELKGLRPDQAAEAIVQPAAVVGDEYLCPPFEVHPEALREILESLSTRQISSIADEPEIESFQLQLVCNHLEEKMLEQHQHGILPLLVTVETFGGKAGIERLLSDFYRNTLQAIADESERHNAQVTVEDDLIKNKRRVSVAEASILQGAHALRQETLRFLVDKRLLRREERPGLGRYYELAHDTLLPPILIFAQERRIRAAEALAHLKRQATLRKWGWTVLGIGLMVMAIMAVLFYFARRDRIRAQLNYFLAESRLTAEQDNTRAFRLAEEARALGPDNTEAIGAMIHAFYGTLFKLGDTLYAAPKYREYAAKWVKAVSGSSNILMLQPDGDTILLLDPYTRLVKKIPVAGKPRDAALSPDGRWLLSIQADNSVQRIQAADAPDTLPLLLPFKALSMAISADGNYFTTNCPDGKQRLWSADGRLLREFENIATLDLVKKQVAFTPDSRQLLVLKDSITAQLYALPPEAAQPVDIRTSGNIQNAAFSANSQYIALVVDTSAGGILNAVGIQKVCQYDLRGNIQLQPKLDAYFRNVSTATPTLEGDSILLDGKTDQIWLLGRAGKHRVLANGMLTSRSSRAKALFSYQEQIVTYNFGDKIIRLRDIKRNAELYTLYHRERVADFFFTPDQRFLVVKTTANKVRVWDLQAYAVVQNRALWPTGAFFKPGSADIMSKDETGVWSCNGSPANCPSWLKDSVKIVVPWKDGNTVLLQYASGNMYRLNTRHDPGQPEFFATLSQPASAVPVIAGDRVAVCIEDTVVQIFDSRGTTILRLVPGKRISALELSPDGRKVALALSDSSVVIRSLSNGRTDTCYFDLIVKSLAFDATGKSLLIGVKGKVLRWNTSAAKPEGFLLNQHEEDFSVDAIACSPDGRFLATGSTDRNIALWNDKGRWLHSFALPQSYGGANRLQFSDDSRYLWSEQYKKAVFRWTLDPEVLIHEMKIAQELSAEERRLYKLK